jgi:naphthoate synthase
MAPPHRRAQREEVIGRARARLAPHGGPELAPVERDAAAAQPVVEGARPTHRLPGELEALDLAEKVAEERRAARPLPAMKSSVGALGMANLASVSSRRKAPGRGCGQSESRPIIAMRQRGAMAHRRRPTKESGGPMDYGDILYDKQGGIAWITINRPEVRNAFRTRTVAELTDAFVDARWDPTIGVVVLTGAGDKAFCSGGDQKERGQGGYAKDQRPMDVEALHNAIRHIPKPVIAMVNGFAIGGGHVLHVLCDLSIAADTAVFGQTGPRVGSVDAGHGTGFLARVVGEKKAREIWYLCRQYSAQDALQMGLVNKVVPQKALRAEVEQWCAELLEKSPTALALAKQSFNVDSEQRGGVAQFAGTALNLYYHTEEAMEGRNAFVEKRPVNFGKFRK